MYRFNSFTNKSNQAINYAIKLAGDLGHNYVGTEHLMLGLLKESSNSYLFESFNLYFEDYCTLITDNIGLGNPTKLSPENFSPKARKVIELSYSAAKKTYHSFVSTEHIITSILKEDCTAVKLLNQLDINEEKLLNSLLLNHNQDNPQNKNKKTKSKTPTLDEFGIDLTEKAKQGKIDAVIGREKEIQRTIQILSRRNKNNPCLIGEPGVGKTAIAEGLACKIVNNEVPDLLKNTKLYSLDLISMVAGTKYRGDFEERIKKVMDEVSDANDVIIFIDEVHNIMGAGSAEGAVDAANILKPSLARGDIQIIGATTITEYKQKIEKDSALERRFQPIIVDEPTEEEAIEIINGLKDKYESHHNVVINDNAIKSAVNLSIRYINDRFLPDKAIDLIDEASSYVRMNKDVKVVIDEDIANVVSSWTGIPVNELSKSETEKLLNIEDEIKQKIIGQDKAIDIVVNAIKRNRVGLKNPNKPIGCFLFVGPTGVGKTELCKVLADKVFGSENAIIRLDMSEYMEKQSASKLIGSPPGYVGFDEGGQLTDKVRRKPYTIILFDEIEKAHKDIFNLLLQVLDEGVLTDSQGRKVSFKNSIIIMTSNIGASAITNDKKTLGFVEYDMSVESQVMPEIKKTFKPEFINRLDEIVVFNKLSKNDIKDIVYILLNELAQRVKSIGINILFTDNVIEEITNKGYDKNYGARPLQRVIQKEIEDKLSQMILNNELVKNNSYLIDHNGETIVKSIKDVVTI